MEKDKEIRIDIVEIFIAIMVFIIMTNIVAIGKDIRIIYKDTLLQNTNYYENERGEIVSKW